jgi:hypothetical protein
MATSGVSTFEETRDDILQESLENLGAIAPNETRSANNSDLFDAAARALNRVVKSIDKDGQFLWRYVRRTTTTTGTTAVPQSSFALASDVLTIDAPMNFKLSTEDTRSLIEPMPRDEFMKIGNRLTTGVPNRYYIEYTLGVRTVYLDPIVITSGDSIEYAAVLRGQDFTTGADTPDFTSKWASCLVYGTTMELCPKFRQAAQIGTWKQLFEDEKSRLEMDDGERGDMTFVPFQGYRSGAG